MKPRHALLAGLVLLILFAAAVVLFPDRKTRALREAPGVDLLFPGGALLDTTRSRSIFGSGAHVMRVYGTDSPPEPIVAFFDAELGKLGYTPTAPTLDEHFPAGEHHAIRQYKNGMFTYRLFLMPPPLRVGGRAITHEYRHLLFARISN